MFHLHHVNDDDPGTAQLDDLAVAAAALQQQLGARADREGGGGSHPAASGQPSPAEATAESAPAFVSPPRVPTPRHFDSEVRVTLLQSSAMGSREALCAYRCRPRPLQTQAGHNVQPGDAMTSLFVLSADASGAGGGVTARDPGVPPGCPRLVAAENFSAKARCRCLCTWRRRRSRRLRL